MWNCVETEIHEFVLDINCGLYIINDKIIQNTFVIIRFWVNNLFDKKNWILIPFGSHLADFYCFSNVLLLL